MPPRQVVLVTGSSSGIGLATAIEAVRRGHLVYASSRRTDGLPPELAASGAKPLRLDVTEPGAPARAVGQVLSEAGRLDALVNNAGHAQYGAIEDVSEDQWRRQYDVTVFGAIEMIRAALPAMRAARGGTIVNVSSVGGRVTVPFAAPYCSAKHALESISDSLRVEVSPFGIRVVIVEPGPIETQFTPRAKEAVAGILERPGPYSRFYETVKQGMEGDFQKTIQPPEAVARVVVDAIESERPKTRYRVTGMAKLLIPLRRLLSDRLLDAAFRKSLKIPKRI